MSGAGEGAERGPVVLTLNESLTQASASTLAEQVSHAPTGDRVVIDLTAIPGFDSEGARVLADLQDSVGPARLSIVGLRQATTRLMDLTGGTDARPGEGLGDLHIERLHNTVVIRSGGGQPVTGRLLDDALGRALTADVSIVVVDLKDVGPLPVSAIEALSFASSAAALRGRELLVVNVTAVDGEQLRRSGLSATTFVAPEPLA